MLNWKSFKENLKHKHIAIFGLGKSGLSTAKACVENNIDITVWDDNEESRKKAEALGAKISDLTQDDLSNYDYLILAPGIPYTFEPHDIVINAQKYNLQIIGDVELLHKIGMPCQTIGITGTNGKSTTTALMTHILNENGKNAIMAGNIGIPVFDIDFIKNYDFLVLELSSYQLDLCPNFRPDYSILLNISSDHLDRHGSIEEYIKSKSYILEGEGIAVVDIDDDFNQVLFDKNFIEGKRKYIPASVHYEIPEGFFVKKNNLYKNRHGENHLIGSLESLPTLRGVHNQQNIICCYIICNEIGIEDQNFFDSLQNFAGLPHRQYLVTQKDNIIFINDSKATNAEAASKALSSYDDIFWIIGGRAKKDGLQGLEIFKDKIIKTYVIGEATDRFAEWLEAHHFIFEKCNTIQKATKKAYQDANQFDQDAVILLSPACASWDQFASFEERGNAFEQTVKEITK